MVVNQILHANSNNKFAQYKAESTLLTNHYFELIFRQKLQNIKVQY